MPKVNKNAIKGLAGVGIKDSDVEIQRDTSLTFAHILAEGLGLWPDVGTSGDLRN